MPTPEDKIHIIEVSPRWLSTSWFDSTKFITLPQLSILKHTLKITVFKSKGEGMRVLEKNIDSDLDIAFEIPNALRAYMQCLLDFKTIKIHIDTKEKTLDVIAEKSTVAIQYHIPNLNFVEHKFIEESEKDISIEVETENWLQICKTLPTKGKIDIQCCFNKKTITLKHSKNKWGGGITARQKSKATKSFCCSSNVVKFICKIDNEYPTFSTITFMECGVFKWVVGPYTCFFAPYVENEKLEDF